MEQVEKIHIISFLLISLKNHLKKACSLKNESEICKGK